MSAMLISINTLRNGFPLRLDRERSTIMCSIFSVMDTVMIANRGKLLKPRHTFMLFGHIFKVMGDVIFLKLILELSDEGNSFVNNRVSHRRDVD